jgi:hypothetical protein
MKQGRVFTNIKARIDLVTQITYFVSFSGIEASIPKGMIKEITLTDTTANGILSYKLQTGFPPVDKQTPENFYQILAEGKCSFLVAILKRVTETKNDLNGETLKQYDTSEEYYFYSNGAMKKWKKDKEFILSELGDKEAGVNQFIQTNKTNFRSKEDIAKLVAYYNSLF